MNYVYSKRKFLWNVRRIGLWAAKGAGLAAAEFF